MLGINLLLVAWIWLGRLFVGSTGWFVLFFPFTVGPVLVGALVVTTVMVRRRYPKSVWTATRGPAGLTTMTAWQTIAQLVAWIGLLGAGFFLVDTGDTGDKERSVFSTVFAMLRVFGPQEELRHLSYSLVTLCVGVFAVGWLALLALLVWRGPVETAAARGLPEAQEPQWGLVGY